MDTHERDIELMEYIEVLLKRKQLIVTGTLLCAAVTGLLVLLQPQQYQARALIVISPAIASAGQGQQDEGIAAALGSDIVVPGLAAEAYEALAKGDELLYLLKDSLLHVGLSAEIQSELLELDLEEMAVDMLEADLLAATAEAKSPLLEFRAQSPQDELPIAMVNLWAELFVERNRGLSSNVADDYYQWVQSQYDIAKDKLEDTEKELEEISAAYHSLYVLETGVAIRTTRLDTALKAYQSTQTSLESAQRERDYLYGKLAEVELGGEWLGYTPVEQLPDPARLPAGTPAARRDLIAVVYDRREAEDDSLRLAEQHEERQRQFKAKREQELLAFEQETGIDRVNQEAAQLTSTLAEYRTESAQLDQQLKDLSMELAVHLQNRELEPRVLTVSKAITDEALWESMASGGRVDEHSQRELGAYKLTSEQLNPTHQELSARIRTLQVQYDRSEFQASFLMEEIPWLEDRLLAVQAKLDTLKGPQETLMQRLEREWVDMARELWQQAKPLAQRLSRKRDTLTEYQDEYAKMRRKAERLDRQLIALTSTLGYEKESFENWSEQLQEGAAWMDSLRLVRRRLERDMTVIQTTFQRFAKLAEEARIAREQAAGDIQVVSRAAFAHPLERNEILKSCIAAVVGLMVSVVLAFLRE